jgi:serine/threonine protein kinase/tetratricopeptide (TPR) repeat protein
VTRDGDSSDDAFAATIAPASTTGPRSETDSIASDATMAAPSSSAPTPPSKLPMGTVAAAGADPSVYLPQVPLGHYRTDREIARGGMGRIVAAEDRRLKRPVAIKQLLEPAGDQLARFQREALITARLQHPGIVPVYEAGVWPDGEPFFAMKLVSGRPFDKVLAEAVTLEDRLALLPRLAAACDAIAYAHSQRVIHRDLKPSNVLLGDFGETVVIDWGLAKDLDAEDSFDGRVTAPRKPKASERSEPSEPESSTLTVAGAVMGTPAYMAPEQARGEPLDQRADVFALGAMLYHLLAGAPPYNARTATDVLAAAALGKIVPLRERERRVPVELVTIVEHAMQPVPQERYAHAGELAEDLRRFLTGQLVDAHRYTAMQRMTRFVKRHRAAVTVSLIAVVTFAVGGTIAVRNVIHARDHAEAESAIANTRKVAAERLIDYMFSDMKSRLGTIGRLDLMAGLGAEVRRYYDRLAKVPGGMPREDQIRWAEAMQLIGEAEAKSGNTDKALATWKEARARLAEIVAHSDGKPVRRLKRAIALFDFHLGTVYQERARNKQAIETYRLAKAELDALEVEDPSAREVLLAAADTHDRLGDLLRNDGKIDEAFEEYSEAKTERERASAQGNGKVSDEVLALSTSHLKLASVYESRGESSTALEAYKKALRLRETLAEGQPDNVVFQEGVLEVEDQLAALQRQIGDEAAAIETYRQALPVTAELVQRDPTNTDWQRKRGNMLADLGFALIDAGQFKDGLAQIDDAIDVQKSLVARDPKGTPYQVDLSRSYTRAGDALMYSGKIDEGIARYRDALEIRKKLVAKEPTSAVFRRSLAWAFSKLANGYVVKADLAAAIDWHEQALELRTKLVAESPSQGAFKNELASTEVEFGKLLTVRDPKRGGELVEAGIKRARILVDGDAINNEWKETLVQGLLARAAIAKARGDAKVRAASLTEAQGVAEDAQKRAPTNAHWPGYLAEIHAGLAEVAPDPTTAAAEWKAVRELLEPLAKAGRLPAPRLHLLDRARAASR